MPTIYFDTVITTQFSDGVVRLGVCDFVGAPQDGKRPMGEVTHLATSLPGLLQLQTQINQLIEGLVEKQILRKQDPAPPKPGS